MTKTKRLLLLGVLLSPVALLPTAFIVARVWLNQHLQRDLSFAGFGLHLTNPILGWDLDFRSDSLEVSSPRFSLRSGKIATDWRIWNSIASLKPSLSVVADTIRMRVEPDPADSVERARKRKRGKIPSFPNVRIPVAIRVSAIRVEMAMGDKPVARLDGLSFYSQGPKGFTLEATGIALPAKGDSGLVSLAGTYRASARWFGKNLRYQFRVQDPEGNFLRLDGERRKGDLRVGKDSVDASLKAFTTYAPFLRTIRSEMPQVPGQRPKGIPDFRNMTLQASLEMGKDHRSIHLHAGFQSPAVWRIRPQQVDVTAKLEDSSGRVTIRSHGEADESAYLQGRFHLPNLDSGFARATREMTANLSGFTRNFRFRIGRRMLPGDAEIRRLRLLPGLVVEADVRTRDSSVFHGRAFRDGDSSARVPLAASGAIAANSVSAGSNAWKCAFTGTIDPGETWVHAWVDTNVSFRHARVSGEAGKRGLKVETWIRQPKAYGSAADSLYAVQTVDKSGYVLTSSRVYAKDAVWPVTGQVKWGKRQPAEGGHRRKRKVSLAFRTKHPRYGSAEYSMAGPGKMEIKVENLDARKLPYVRFAKLMALRPIATGGFAWDIRERTGWVDAASELEYKGRNLRVAAKADWDARRFSAKGLDISFSDSRLRLSGDARLSGRHFFQLGKLHVKDIQGLALEADRFDAAGLSDFLGKRYPVDRGILKGKLAYTDTTGFLGTYEMHDLELHPAKKFLAIPYLALIGEGETLRLSMRTVSPTHPWLNDSVTLRVNDILGRNPAIGFKAVSADGLVISFQGSARELRELDGNFSLNGRVVLPGQAGEIKDARMGGHILAPLNKSLLRELVLDSGSFAGRYAVPGLDTQNVTGTISMRNGRLAVPDLRATDKAGIGMTGEALCDVSGSPRVSAKLRGGNLALQWPGIQKLVLKGADASLRIDSTGVWAQAMVGNAGFASSKPPVSMRGSLEGMNIEYFRPPAYKSAKGGSPSAAGAAIPRLKVKAKLRDFTFRHKIGFRELQRSIRTVKVDKRKKRVKPIEVQLDIETAGSGNRVETDILRMVFAGDIHVRGVYPYTLLTGEFSALSGEIGQTSQSYDITGFDLKWQNATVEEGRLSVEGGKKLRSDCKPDTKRTCNVYVRLAGRLDEMAFTYDTDCGGNTGATLEPSALINSVSRGCYSDEYVAGGGGGNYGEAVFALLEPTINEKLSSVGSTFSGGWIKRTAVTGIGTAVSGDTAGSEPIAIGVESKEKWGMSIKAKAGYHPEKKLPNPWENKVALEWRPPLEKASKSSEWKRRVRDRVTLEASAETRPEEKINKENRQVRKQVGLRYRYKFWNLW